MPSSELKLLTLNIAHGRGPILHQGLVKQKTILKWMGKIADLLIDQQPDIVALQEIDEDSQWNGNWTFLSFSDVRAGMKMQPTECTIATTGSTDSITATPSSQNIQL
ncbi:MAG: endonuclease/exonuclease/phosphatase family protein [Verrucomicrobia bacterium]|nr:endonuclease/exonuclease/phosphatase family protein [Verrucomicrobiota bacterium]MDA1068309.1 endonuclease/exonuclease/phosphatase family protein [Verrucomicrobiota bacterium]